MDILKIKKNKREKVEEKKIEKKEVKKEKTLSRKINENYLCLRSAHISEKAGDLAEKNQYIFKVYPETNKIEIKKAIKETFKVDPVSVKIINVFKKKRRSGRIKGWRKGYKKAIVKIKEGQKIDLLPR